MSSQANFLLTLVSFPDLQEEWETASESSEHFKDAAAPLSSADDTTRSRAAGSDHQNGHHQRQQAREYRGSRPSRGGGVVSEQRGSSRGGSRGAGAASRGRGGREGGSKFSKDSTADGDSKVSTLSSLGSTFVSVVFLC